MRAIIRSEEDCAYYRRIVRDDVFAVKKVGGCRGVVYDLGAHIGLFSLMCLEHTKADVVGVEPDLENFKTYTQNLSVVNDYANRADPILGALSYENGSAMFYRDPLAWSRDTGSIFQGGPTSVVDTIVPEKIFKRKDVLYLKANIEGAEIYLMDWLLEEKTILQNAKKISIELHPGLVGRKEQGQMFRFAKAVLDERKDGIEMRIASCGKGQWDDAFSLLERNTL